MELTAQQSKVLAAIWRYWLRYGAPPSLRDLMPATDTTSPNGVVCHLKALAKKGAIEWERDGTARGIWPGDLRKRIQGIACLLLGDSCRLEPVGGTERDDVPDA